MLNENLCELSKITQAHCGIIALIHAECFPHDPWSQQTFENFCKEAWGKAIGWLALYEDNPVGFILARQVIDTAEILSFAVLPNFQGEGIGKQLLGQLMRNIEKPLFLEVSVGNKAAIHLYQSHGFEIMAIRKNYYNKPDAQGSRDAYLMRLVP